MLCVPNMSFSHMRHFVYSYEAYPNGIAYLLGYILIICFTFFLCRPVIAKHGTFDIFTELYIRFKPDHYLHELKKDTADAYDSGAGTASPFGFLKRNGDGRGGAMTKGEEQPLADEEKDVVDDVQDYEEEGVINDKLLPETTSVSERELES